MHGIGGDFTVHLGHLPTDGIPLVAFLGSTIGNFYVEERRAFLAMLAEHLPDSGWLLLGVDLAKPVDRLVHAYDEIRVEVSSKFRVDGISVELLDAGFDPRHVWTDLRGDVAVILAARR